MKKKIILPALLTITLLTLGWITYANGEKWGLVNKATPGGLTLHTEARPDNAADWSGEEKELLKEFLSLYEGFDQGSLFIEGAVSLHDPADSAATRAPVPFTFHQQGTTLYYRSGGQQVLNTPDYYAAADGELKRIVVGAPKSAIPLPVFPPSNMSRLLKEEGYTITKEVQGETATIRLLSEQHVSCKEITVRFVEATKKPLSFYYRLTDLDHPDEKEYDKTIQVSIHGWLREGGEVARMAMPRLIEYSREAVRPAAGFSDFEIINLINP